MIKNVRELLNSSEKRHEYFSKSANAADVLWTSGDKPHGVDFGYLTTGESWNVVDVFRGMLPRYYDVSSPDGNGVTLRLALTLVLDSNIAGVLLSYVEGGMKDAGARAAVERFLCWFASTPQMNVTPAYNLIERFPRSADQIKAETMAYRTARSILEIETMDRSYYLATGLLRPSADVSEILRSQSGSDDFEAIARRAVADTARLAHGQVKDFYAFLLKIALISALRGKPRALVEKIDELVEFVERRFWLAGPLEVAAAMLQFTGGLGKFATISATMSFEAVKERITRAAWDLAYMRTPQMMLSTSTPRRTNLAFVLTGDRDAARIIRLAEFRMILVTQGRSLPFVDADFASVREAFPHKDIFDQAFSRLKAFFDRRRRSRPIRPDTDALIAELHTELKAYLRKDIVR